MKRYRFVLFALACSLCSFSLCSEASEPRAGAEKHREELIVTSRIREEVPEEVPIALTIFGKEQLEEANIESVADFFALTPNVSFAQSQNPGNVTITVRGISQVRNGEAPVAVIIDGMHLASPNAINIDLYDIERIEFMRGPRGALYGRNAIAGVISIVTKQPTAETEQRVNLGIGKANEQEVTYARGGPLAGDHLFFRIAALFRDREGYFTNDTLEMDADPKTDRSGSLKLSYLPNERFSLGFKAALSETEDGGPYFIPVTSGNPDEVGTNPVSDRLPFAERNLGDVSLEFGYQSPLGTLKYQTGYSGLDEILFGDEYSAAPIIWASQDLDVTASTHELRFVSREDRPLRWILGGLFQNVQRNINTIGAIDLDGDGFFEIPLDRREKNENTNQALFAEASIVPRDDIEISLAFRFDHDRREQTDQVTGLTRELVFEKPQPRVSAVWFPGDERNTMTYMTYAEGYRAGGFNSPDVAAFPQLYLEEITETYELGFKHDVRSLWRINAALFHTDYRNQQYFQFDADTLGQGILNIESSVALGGEIEIDGSLPYGFQIAASLGVTDSTIDALESRGISHSGNKTPNVDGHTSNLAVIYRCTLENAFSLVARADFRNVGERYWHIDNIDKRKHLNIANLHLGASTERWRISLNLDDLTNERYNAEFVADEYTGFGYDVRFPAPPRTYSMAFTWKM